MHCPSCGQQQASEETKFCSRCGLPLSLIAEVVLQGGYLPQLAALDEKKPPLFNKKNGVFASIIWFIFFTMFATSFLAIMSAPDEAVATMAILGVFGGLMMLIGSLVFLPSSKPAWMRSSPAFNPGQTPMPATLHGRQPSGNALPPQTTYPASTEYKAPGVGSWRDSKELHPTSVTEGTTRLLDQEEAKKLPQ